MPIYLGSSKIERVASSACRLQSKTVTPSSQTQVITPDDGYNGFNECTINGDSNLISENIKSGVSIFGVAGTCAGSGSDSGFHTAATCCYYSATCASNTDTISIQTIIDSIYSLCIFGTNKSSSALNQICGLYYDGLTSTTLYVTNGYSRTNNVSSNDAPTITINNGRLTIVLPNSLSYYFRDEYDIYAVCTTTSGSSLH